MEDEINRQPWFFTFGTGQEILANKYVRIWGTFEEARSYMFESFGAKWAFQYGEKEFEPIRKRYGLTELKR